MRLNTMTSSVIHQMLNKDTNVIYYPTLGLFDHVLYLTGNNFFVFANNLKPCADNCRCLDSNFIDIYDYDICITNSIISYKKQCESLSQGFNVGPIIFEHNLPDASLKKEDKFILNNDLSRVKKIFFDADIQRVWGISNSSCYDYGIPTDMFVPIPDIEKTKTILISSSDQTNANVLGKQLKQHVESNLKLQCDIISNLAEAPINVINHMFNNYEVFIDLNNRSIDCLCAASAGLGTIGLSNLKNIDKVPNINQVNTIQDIVNTIPKIQDQNVNIEQTRKYIDENFNFTKFKNIINNIFKNIKREAKVI